MGRDLNSRPPVCETGILTRLDYPSILVLHLSIENKNLYTSNIVKELLLIFNKKLLCVARKVILYKSELLFKEKDYLITTNKLHQYTKQKVQLVYTVDASKDQRNN